MRQLPVDTDRIKLISTGVVSPVPLWVELSDGSRRPDPNGRQEVDDQGRGAYRVEVIAPADAEDERDKTGIVEITIYSKDAPDVGSFGTEVRFEGLTCSLPYLQKKTGTLSAPRWSADGVRRQGGKPQQHQPQAQAA